MFGPSLLFARYKQGFSRPGAPTATINYYRSYFDHETRHAVPVSFVRLLTTWTSFILVLPSRNSAHVHACMLACMQVALTGVQEGEISSEWEAAHAGAHAVRSQRCCSGATAPEGMIYGLSTPCWRAVKLTCCQVMMQTSFPRNGTQSFF